MDWKTDFVGTRVTIMGIDPEGRGVQDAAFVARYGAHVIVTDLRGDDDLRVSLDTLRQFPNIRYRLGGHAADDFVHTDLVIRAASAPIGSPFIVAAQKARVRVETDETLFEALAPAHTLIGITGTRGKTTTTHMIYEILSAAYPKRVHIAGNVRGRAALPLLEVVKEGDLVVMEFASWQLQQFGLNKASPAVAVFTTFYPDHLIYYHGSLDAYLDDKAQIFLHQNPDDTLVVSEQAIAAIEKYKNKIKSHVLVAKQGRLDLAVPGAHNQLNAACALEAARALGVDDQVSLKALKGFTGVPGRLELVREYKGIQIYNDTTATTADATLAAIETLSHDRPTRSIILIMGGADKGLDMGKLLDRLSAMKRTVLLKGTGTDLIMNKLPDAPVYERLDLAVQDAFEHAKEGDSVLLSPGFASKGMFKNEYDRGDQFNALIHALT